MQKQSYNSLSLANGISRVDNERVAKLHDTSFASPPAKEVKYFSAFKRASKKFKNATDGEESVSYAIWNGVGKNT